MSVNAREEQYEHVKLFGKPALFTDSRIDRSTVPTGFYCYDLRGYDRDPGKPVALENQVVVNHAGTVLTTEPVTIPKEGFRRLRGKLNFLGECLTLSEFCEEHGLELKVDNGKLNLRPASSDKAGLFFALSKEQDAKLATIGHLRVDFGSNGHEFWHTWWPRDYEKFHGSAFESELKRVVDALREDGPLENLPAMSLYCTSHGGEIEGGWRQNYGYIVETEHYRYCLRCNPGPGDYQAYLTVFDLRQQELNMKNEATTQNLGLTEAGKQKLKNAADPTLSHSYAWFVYQDYNVAGEKLTRGLTLQEAIHLFNEMDSGNKRLGVTKDDIATVDIVITLNGEQKFSKDYTQLASFSSDPVIVLAVETLRNEITEQTPEQGMKMGGM
ncbi:MAG: LPD28 domain-containing protein [Lachnospiraceae bacterium]|nr:LPD28 domain-containing protein [Lachnospiraceae bacterium]